MGILRLGAVTQRWRGRPSYEDKVEKVLASNLSLKIWAIAVEAISASNDQETLFLTTVIDISLTNFYLCMPGT
jgi:hypothetical protein